jgi:DNA-binding NtrC family response regulator
MKKNIILCVDDEKIILNSLKTQLKEHYGNNYIYETAENVNEAYEVIDELIEEQGNLVVIVSDWLMPEIKGDEFLINIHRKYPHIVKIMLTGQADASAIERSKKEANLFKCLNKPWTETDLIETIDSGIMLNHQEL